MTVPGLVTAEGQGRCHSMAENPRERTPVLTSLRIRNFKAWHDTGNIELAPLTILFGANSSGKSSLHQFLLLLRQTVESPDRRRVLHTGDDATPVDLGSFSSLVRDTNPMSTLEFDLSWRTPVPLQIESGQQSGRFKGRDLTFHGRIGTGDETPPRVRVEEYHYTLHTDDGRRLLLGGRRDPKGKYSLLSEGIVPIWRVGQKWPPSGPSQFHAFPDDLAAKYQNLEFAPDLTLALEKQLGALNYLGPLREKPGRLYRWSGEEVGHVGFRGERTVEALLAGRRREFNTAAHKRLEPLQVVVARWLEALGLVESFEVAAIGEGRDEYEVRVRTRGTSRDVLLTDVGFGVSQVLPVIVECFYAAPGSTIIMEQPEIHLHPAVQVRLADLFIETIRMRENAKPRDMQLIVESHSEHLLRRLLRRIAEGEVSPEEVRCYVASPAPDGARIEPLQLDAFGNVHNWPQEFFGNPAEDLVAQSRSARERRRHERQDMSTP
jgi:predicted ATPase